MAAITGKVQCFICGGKEKSTYNCRGCAQDFCFTHLTEHRSILNQQLDEIENDRDQFRQLIIEEKENSRGHLLIKQIDQWESNSIHQIKQTAKEYRQLVIEQTNKYVNQIEHELKQLTDQMKEIRQENEFNEIDLNQLKTKLIKLTEQLDKSPNTSISEDPTPLIYKISINITPDTQWRQNGITIAGGNGKGNGLNQLSQPCGIYIDDDQTIYIADCDNHRIVAWKCGAKSGQVVAGGNGKGNRNNQLNRPSDIIIDKQKNFLIIADRQNNRVVRWPYQNNAQGQVIISDICCLGVTMDNNGDIYVSDTRKHEVRRWKIGDHVGTIVAGGNGQGNQLNQFNFPSSIFVDKDYSVYVIDRNNNRLMKWMKDAKEGIIVAGGQGQGNSLTQLPSPQGIIINELGHIYVAESGNHRVMRRWKGITQGSVIVGGNGQGEQSNQFNAPIDLSFDVRGNLYVSDYWNHRIQKFEIDLS